LLENIFRSINIALVNELKMTFLSMGIDVWEVIAAASTKPFGYMPFYPGPGLGGHCIPLDPFYLSWKAAEHGMWARFIELAGEINTQMPRFVISRVASALNEAGKALKGSRVLVLGLSYKANIDDCRESPSFELLDQLADAGAVVQYCDPYFPVAPLTRKYKFELRSVPCTPAAFAEFDALVVATAHDEFKKPELYRDVKLVVDSRNMIAPLLKDLRDSTLRLVKA
jgi:UDP-N-acetyl-D-glucosamine dehydrogenase